MSFIADKQTLEDLNLLGRFKANAVFGIFNRVKTAGGERLLEAMFREPLTNYTDINKRSGLFHYFGTPDLSFPFEKEPFQVAEQYLSGAAAGNYFAIVTGLLRKKAAAALLRDEQLGQLRDGVLQTIEVLNKFKRFIDSLPVHELHLFAPISKEVKLILADERLRWLFMAENKKELTLLQLARYDYVLRSAMQPQMNKLLEVIYQLDVYIAVGNVARQRDFVYARALPKEKHIMNVSGLRHSGLENGVGNTLLLDKAQNMLFLTGANMSGKSTFMKSFGIAVYLAHMGFPVAAKEMVFSVCDGLYSSINVADNLPMGYSHFYAEVLRVKTVAKEVSGGKNLVVIFDELFKGTNVKDAYDATLAITASFAAYRNCRFIISTHIVEVGEALGERGNNVQFAYMPTIMEGSVPKYPYTLTPGITADRHGMMIIRNEKILELLGRPAHGHSEKI